MAEVDRRRGLRSSDTPRRFGRFGLVAALLSLCSSPSLAAEETVDAKLGAPPGQPFARAPQGITLKRCIELAAQNYPKVHEAKARLAAKRAQLDIAHYQPYSDFTATAAVVPAPAVYGTQIFSPNSDAALTSNMGLAWQAGVEGAIPLWTFGKITNLWDAAEAQVTLGQHEVDKEKNDLKLEVRKAYYGVLLARDALAIVRDALTRIDKYLPRLATKVESGDGDEIDLLKLRMNRAELEARESQARQSEAVALSGLGFLTGLGRSIQLPDVPLPRARHELGPLPRYLSAARLYRPEINMARAGVLAREAQLRLEEARYFPDLALGLSYKVGYAGEVTDQRNPYAYDRANFRGYGASLLLRYKLDFLPQIGRVSQAEANLEEVRAKERYALGGVAFEVEEAFRTAEDAKRRLDAYARASQFAKQWLIQVQQGIDIGTMEENDVLEPAKEYAFKRYAVMGAVFDYNLALAKLALATGWDAVAGDE
jgi:outer membrane protein TolC